MSFFDDIFSKLREFSEAVFRRPDGTTYVAAGYQYSPQKIAAAAAPETRIAYSADQLPNKVDLRSYMTDIENQGRLSSCVANAVAGAYEYLAHQHTGEVYDVSRLFIYYNARSRSNMQNQDKGCYICDAMESLRSHGACSEDTYPYEESAVNRKPHDDAYSEAEAFLVESIERVPLDLNAWKSVLAEGYPIVFGVVLFKSFDKQRKKGLVPMPTPDEGSRGAHGAHAMLCVGYSDRDRVFIVRNSWGTQWGDDGYCYIPYDYMMDPKINLRDNWVLRQLDNFGDNEESWSEDEESVLEDFDNEIANMSDEAYAEMLDAMGDDYPLEFRLGLIVLAAASADGDLGDDEYDEIAGYLDGVLETLGIDYLDSEELLENCGEYLEDEDLIHESVELIGEHLSAGALAKIINDIEAMLEVDDLADEESEFLQYLVESWQVSDEESEEDGDNEESEEDGDYEESEEDGDYEESEEDGDYEESEEDGDYEESEEDGDYEESEEDGDYEESEEDGDYDEEDEEYYDDEEEEDESPRKKK